MPREPVATKSVSSEITGQTYGRLTVLESAGKNKHGHQIWLCQCECGTTTKVTGYNLRNGGTKSCGCLRSERDLEHLKIGQEKLREHIEKDCVSGTRVSLLDKKINKNNTSGVKGVHKNKQSGKWVATIVFQRKPIYLGAFDKLTDAKKARKQAETKYFEPVIQGAAPPPTPTSKQIRYWTTKEIQYVKEEALLDITNSVVNVEEISNQLNRSKKAIENRIRQLREDGMLPRIDKSLDMGEGRGYSVEEKKQIANMYQLNCPAKDIAERFDRTESAIYGIIGKMKKSGEIKPRPIRKWTDKKVKILIDRITFDENGYTNNMAELQRLVDMRYQAVSKKISELRKDGRIKILPDKAKTSVASKKAHQRFNDQRFAHVRKESNEVSQKIMSVQSSKLVQVILTVVKDQDGNEIHQFFSTDGMLLAEKKTDSPAS